MPAANIRAILTVQVLGRGLRHARLGSQQTDDEPVAHQIVTLNAEILYKAQSNPKLLEVINQAVLSQP